MGETHFKTCQIHSSFIKASWLRWEGCKFDDQFMLQKEFEASLGSSHETPIYLEIKIKCVADKQSVMQLFLVISEGSVLYVTSCSTIF